jgi:PAS domain S-box-containing protein
LVLREDVTEQRQAEEELRRNRALLRAVFDTIPYALYVKDNEGRFLIANQATARNGQVPAEELIGMKLRDLPFTRGWTEAQWARVRETDLQALQNGKPVDYEDEFSGPDGLHRYRSIKVPIAGMGGEAASLLVLGEDITARWKGDEELRKSRALLQTVFDNVPVGIVLKDVQGRYVLVNREVARQNSVTSESMIGTIAHEYPGPPSITPAEREMILGTDRQALAGEAVKFEIGLRFASGLRRLKVVKVPVKDATGRVNGILVLRDDVTEQRQAEDELRQSRALLQAVFDTIPHHLFVKDQQRRFLIVNQAMAKDFHRTPGEYAGKTAVDPGPPEHIEAMAREDDPVLVRGASMEREIARMMPDGKVHHYHVTQVPLRDAQGTVVGLLGLAQDITLRILAEWKRAELEAQLQQAHRLELIGQLSAGVSHDFNNLLTPIFGHAELLLAESGLPESVRASANVILSAAERGAELTRGLLAFGRKQVLNRKELCLNDAVRTWQPILGRLIGKSIDVRFDLADGLGRVLADSSQIQQVLLNLSVNARDAMPDGGFLVIGTQNEELDASFTEGNPGISPGPYVMLSVSDTGHGIDAETLKRIFEPFFTTKESGKGTGLGLSIVHGIVQQHGGAIRVYSAPGLGTTFRVFLPRIGNPDPAHVAGVVDASPVPHGHERIIVVDDEETIRKLVCTTLGSYGYAVTEAPDPEQALDLANRADPPFAALVTDLVMPNMSGLSLYQKAAESHTDLRVLYISGHPKHLAEELGYRGVGQHFLAKPFSIERLARAVRETLDA